MIEFSYKLSNLPSFNCQNTLFYPKSAQNSNFNLFNLLSQSLTANICAFEIRLKNSINNVQNDKQPILSDQKIIITNQQLGQKEKNLNQAQILEEKTIIQFQNSIQKSTQNIKDQQSQVFLEQKVNSLEEIQQRQLSKNMVDFINFEASCPKMGLKVHEILQKKQRILGQQVTDWNKIIKKSKNNCNEYSTRQIRMLFK